MKAMTFAEFMEQSLYGPTGYYASGRAHSGRSGDYFTAVDSGPIFGQLLAAMFRRWQESWGGSPFHLVEMGAGEGKLAKTVLSPTSCVLRQAQDPELRTPDTRP